MFVRQPQFRNASADVQIFYGTTTGGGNAMATWNKPPGVSHVYMMLIGPGGYGDSVSGGGSGAVTVWYGAAQNVPDCLEILCYGSSGTSNTEIRYRTTSSSTNQLLVARTGNGAGAGPAMTANAFCASGFFQSVAGQDGSGGSLTGSATTFLSGGTSAGQTVTANYGYTGGTSATKNGNFFLQPIIVGLGGVAGLPGGVGCGGGYTGIGGQGMALIASW